jgi:hypothetical protein
MKQKTTERRAIDYLIYTFRKCINNGVDIILKVLTIIEKSQKTTPNKKAIN